MNFQMHPAYGESLSMGGPDNNDGYWRAVDVYVCATRPAAPNVVPPAPPAPQGSTRFEIRVVSGASASLILSADDYVFQIVDLVKRQKAFFFYSGGGFAISLPKIPGPGSMTYAGPPAEFETTLPVELYQFNSKATLFQGPGAGIGSVSVGGGFGLSVDEMKDAAGTFVATRPSVIPVEGGSGISMPRSRLCDLRRVGAGKRHLPFHRVLSFQTRTDFHRRQQQPQYLHQDHHERRRWWTLRWKAAEAVGL